MNYIQGKIVAAMILLFLLLTLPLSVYLVQQRQIIQKEAAPAEGYTKPIMIAASNYQSYRSSLLNYRPFVVYAWATNPSIESGRYDSEISTLAGINDANIEKMVMYSSYKTLQEKLTQSHADYLKSIGVTWVAFNSEGGMTPVDEMTNLSSTNSSTNSVVQFTNIAKSYGFKVLWGPIRATADNVPDGAVRIMFEAGLDGIGLQEQKFISGESSAKFSGCVNDRVSAVRKTINKYQNQAGGRPFEVNVQIMSSRCVIGDNYAKSSCPSENITYEYQHCDMFVDEIVGMIDSLAIWASGGDDINRLVGFIEMLRSGAAPTPGPPSPTPTPPISPSPTPTSSPRVTPSPTPPPTRRPTPSPSPEGECWQDGDFNCDGEVDLLDFEIFRDIYVEHL